MEARLSTILLDYVVEPKSEVVNSAMFMTLSAELSSCSNEAGIPDANSVQRVARICATTIHTAAAIFPCGSNNQQTTGQVPPQSTFQSAPVLALIRFGGLRRKKNPEENFDFHFLIQFIQQLFARYPDQKVTDEVFAFLEAECVSLNTVDAEAAEDFVREQRKTVAALFASLKRYRPRRMMLVCKSFVPRDIRQSPTTIHELFVLLEDWLDSSPDAATGPVIVEIEKLLASSRMHIVLFIWTIFGVAQSNPVIPTSSSAVETRRPLGRLIKKLTFFEVSPRMLESLVMHVFVVFMRSVPVSPAQALNRGRAEMQKILFQLLNHELISLQGTYLLYSELLCPPFADNAAASPIALFSDAARALEQITKDLTNFSTAASAERNVTHSLHSRVAENRSTAAFSTISNEIPSDGSLVGPRFSSMVFPVPSGSWGEFFLQQRSAGAVLAAPTNIPLSQAAQDLGTQQLKWKFSIVLFVRELIELGYFDQAAHVIQALLDAGINVFLFPSLPNGLENVQEAITKLVSRRSVVIDSMIDQHPEGGDRGLLATSCMEKITPLLPLLVVAQSYLAPSHKFPQLLVTCWSRVMALFTRQKSSSSSLANDRRSAAVAATRQFIARVFLPMLRVMTPSPLIYSIFNTLLETLDPISEVDAALFKDSALSPRYPHDVVIFKEQESLVLSSLKRLTADSIKIYAAMLLPALYANPLFFIEKLLQQAIGFDNEYLPQHTRLLRNAPRPILRLTLALGIDAMKKYAAEERERCEQRVFIIASFLCGVWQNNLSSARGFHSSVFITTIEHALHREARANIIFATEALKAIFFQLLNDSLEHEEQHSATQLSTLGLPYAARWFGRGTAESFYILRWGKGDMTPALLGQLRQCVRDALASRLDDEGEGGDAAAGECVGHKILLRLIRYHSNIYQIHNDLAGTVDQVLLTSGKDFSTFNDLIFMVLEYLPAQALATDADALQAIAMPVLQSLLKSSSFKRQERAVREAADAKEVTKAAENTSEQDEAAALAEPAPSLGDDITLSSVALSEVFNELSLYDIYYDDAAYATVSREMSRWDSKCTAAVPTSAGVPLSGGILARPSFVRNATLSKAPSNATTVKQSPDLASAQWISAQRKWLSAEQDMHRLLVEKTLKIFDGNAAAWLHELSIGGSAHLTDIAHRLFHARALCRVEDALYAGYFLEHLLTRATSSAERRAVIDLVMHIISIVGALFVAYTDSECKKIGVLLCRLVTLLRDDARKKKLCNGDDKNIASEASFKQAAYVNALKNFVPSWLNSNSVPSAAAATETVDLPQYLLDVECYLARVFASLLNNNDVPGFTYRNAFTALERLKNVFPATRAGCKLLILSTQRHAVASAKSTFAAATALIKSYSAVAALSARVEYLVGQELMHELVVATEVKAAPVPVTSAGGLLDDGPLPEDEIPLKEDDEENVLDDQIEEGVPQSGENGQPLDGEGTAENETIADRAESSSSSSSSSKSSAASSLSSASSRASSVSQAPLAAVEGSGDKVDELRVNKRTRSGSREAKRSPSRRSTQ